MATDLLMNRVREASDWTARRLKQRAPKGWNTNTQFLLVFVAVLGLHLWLAQVMFQSAATIEPGDLSPSSLFSEAGSPSSPAAVETSEATASSEGSSGRLRAEPVERLIPEFKPPPPTRPAETLVLTDGSNPAAPVPATATATEQSIDHRSPVALAEAALEESGGAPATPDEDEVVGPVLSDLLAGHSSAEAAPEGESEVAPVVATPIATEAEEEPAKTRAFRDLP